MLGTCVYTVHVHVQANAYYTILYYTIILQRYRYTTSHLYFRYRYYYRDRNLIHVCTCVGVI